MSAVLEPSVHDDAQDLLRQHKGDAEAAVMACLQEIDRLGLALEQATYHSSYGYRWGRLRNPQPVAPAPGGSVKALDIKD